VAQALAGDHDQRSGPGLDGIPRLDIGSAVAADDLPIGAAREDATVELQPAHGSADDPDHTAFAIGRAPETGDSLEFSAN